MRRFTQWLTYCSVVCVFLSIVFIPYTAPAQGIVPYSSEVRVRPYAANVIVPQIRSFNIVPVPHHHESVRIDKVDVKVTILEQVATTVMDISLDNPSRSRQEAELIVPVPEGAVVRGFTFQGAGKEPTAEILTKEEARRIYDQIVAKVRDPALLEFIGYNLVRSSVFPVPPRGTQKVRLTYEHILPTDGNRVDYILPRSESLDYRIPWDIRVTIKSTKSISTVYSPTHEIEVERKKVLEPGEKLSPDTVDTLEVVIRDTARVEPGAFHLSYLLEKNGITASLLAYPDSRPDTGYFLLLAGLPAELPKVSEEPAIKREITLVIDRSGSMRGEKIEQAREAALQIVEGLDETEAFNLIIYNENVEMFSSGPVLKTKENIRRAREYITNIRSGGGTNIHDALLEALRQKPENDMLTMILFLTDGLPTVGKTSEVAIRDMVEKANEYDRRIFTFGVGVDVNAPLLDKISDETRAASTYVLPGEDVEVKVGQVFRRLAGPVLADPEIEVVDAKGNSASEKVQDMIPSRIPDMFEGDQLVLLGRYSGGGPLNFELSGNYLGKKRTFRFSFELKNATTRNSFVPRLWASRKIAVLIDVIRQMGGDPNVHPGSIHDPKMRELVDEIVRLSTEFGILTEYTAFLAREGTNLAEREMVFNEAYDNLRTRAIEARSGLAGINQSLNYRFQKNQVRLNKGNEFYDANMNRVQIANVQQINDLAFYQKGGNWVDSRLVNKGEEIKAKKEIRFGSREFSELAERLVRENRQGAISLKGDILLEVDGEPVLVKAPGQ